MLWFAMTIHNSVRYLCNLIFLQANINFIRMQLFLKAWLRLLILGLVLNLRQGWK